MQTFIQAPLFTYYQTDYHLIAIVNDPEAYIIFCETSYELVCFIYNKNDNINDNNNIRGNDDKTSNTDNNRIFSDYFVP